MSDALLKKKVTTPKFRASYANVFKAKAYGDQEPKFSIVMIFDKSTDLKKMKSAADFAAAEKWGADKKKWPKLRMPFRDGDEERADKEGYENSIFVSASAKESNPPGVVDQNLNRITSETEFYSGCYGRAVLIAFAYDTNGNKGVAFSLQNIQKMGDGKPFSGKKKAEDEFDAVEDESDVESNYGSDDDDIVDI